MNMEFLKNCIEKEKSLYINERKIKVLEIYEIFNICEIVYLDSYEIEMIDVIGISKEKQYNKFISLHRLKGVGF